jgi:NADPH-dependent ferric siderophore reductase
MQANNTTPRGIERIRHESILRNLTVSHIRHLSPGFISITFKSETLKSFASLGFDDHLKFILEDPQGIKHKRDFTPRSFDRDRQELTLEFALHQRGPACEWARQAKVGDIAEISGPRGSMIIPKDYDWYLLVGDASALPAIHRRLEELPSGTHAIVHIHVENSADQRSFASQANLTVKWVASEGALLTSLRAIELPAGTGFAWAAAESAVIGQVREVLLKERQIPLSNTRISAYWKRGSVAFHEEKISPQL